METKVSFKLTILGSHGNRLKVQLTNVRNAPFNRKRMVMIMTEDDSGTLLFFPRIDAFAVSYSRITSTELEGQGLRHPISASQPFSL